MKSSSKTPPPRSARLFTEPHSRVPLTEVHLAYVDGASRGNPGPASYAAIVQSPEGKELVRIGKPIGIATNNAAEYHGLIAALDYAAHHGIRRMRVRSDSELLVNQMNGLYRVRSLDLKPLRERAAKLANQFEYIAIEHVPREMNREADALANEALDRAASVSRAPSSVVEKFESAPASPARRVRARVLKGALVPAEPLDLPEGAEVEITIAKSKSTHR